MYDARQSTSLPCTRRQDSEAALVAIVGKSFSTWCRFDADTCRPPMNFAVAEVSLVLVTLPCRPWATPSFSCLSGPAVHRLGHVPSNIRIGSIQRCAGRGKRPEGGFDNVAGVSADLVEGNFKISVFRQALPKSTQLVYLICSEMLATSSRILSKGGSVYEVSFPFPELVASTTNHQPSSSGQQKRDVDRYEGLCSSTRLNQDQVWHLLRYQFP
jgi:hypothetical protein